MQQRRTRLLDGSSRAGLRLKYEYCVVLKVQGAGGVLSRFLTENDKRYAAGRERAEEVLAAAAAAGKPIEMRCISCVCARGGYV